MTQILHIPNIIFGVSRTLRISQWRGHQEKGTQLVGGDFHLLDKDLVMGMLKYSF